MFTVTVLDILLSKGRLVLSPAQRGTGSERVKEKIRYRRESVTLKVKIIPKKLFQAWMKKTGGAW